jgi:hypothetical protein
LETVDSLYTSRRYYLKVFMSGVAGGLERVVDMKPVCFRRFREA